MRDEIFSIAQKIALTAIKHVVFCRRCIFSILDLMEVICLQDEAFYALIARVIDHINGKQPDKPDKWISGEEAMSMLRITSKTTLQKLRDEGKIRFSQPEKKIILYDLDSLHTYLNKHARETF